MRTSFSLRRIEVSPEKGSTAPKPKPMASVASSSSGYGPFDSDGPDNMNGPLLADPMKGKIDKEGLHEAVLPPAADRDNYGPFGPLHSFV